MLFANLNSNLRSVFPSQFLVNVLIPRVSLIVNKIKIIIYNKGTQLAKVVFQWGSQILLSDFPGNPVIITCINWKMIMNFVKVV